MLDPPEDRRRREGFQWHDHPRRPGTGEPRMGPPACARAAAADGACRPAGARPLRTAGGDGRGSGAPYVPDDAGLPIFARECYACLRLAWRSNQRASQGVPLNEGSARAVRKSFADDFGMVPGDANKCLSSARRRAATLLPLLESALRDAQCLGELRLRQPGALPGLNDFVGFDFRDASCTPSVHFAH